MVVGGGGQYIDEFIIEKCPGIATSAVSAHVISHSTAIDGWIRVLFARSDRAKREFFVPARTHVGGHAHGWSSTCFV